MRWLIVRGLALAFLVAVGACGDAPPPLVDGARPIEFESVARGEPPSPQEVEELVTRLVEVAGGSVRLGKLRWKRVEDLYLAVTGDILGNQVRATTWVRPDQSVRTLLEYRSGESEQRIMFRREEYLQPRLAQLALATGATQQHVEWDWELVRLPVNLLEAERLTALPVRIEEGRTLIGLSVQLPDLNPPFEAWIDPRGPLLVEVRAILPITADLSTRTQAHHWQRLSDWRRVDGVLLPYRRDLFVEGRRIGLGEVVSFEVGLEIPDTVILPKRP